MLEFYWVALPLPDPLAYAQVRENPELLLTARKNTRNFNSPDEWAREGAPKSSLDGLREYEFQKLAGQLRDVPEAIPGEVKRILKRKRAGRGEENLDKKVIARLRRDLEDLESAKPKAGSLSCLAEELVVARALAIAQEQSFRSQEAGMKDAREQLEQILEDIVIDDGGNNANLAD